MTATDKHAETVLITGGARGMGAIAADALAADGATVIIADWEGEAGARLESQQRAAGRDVHFLYVNLAELDSVDALVSTIHRRWPCIDLLMCNAGLTYPVYQSNRAGIDIHLAACHLGHFKLVSGLQPLMAQSRAARVIFVASEGHRACADLATNDPAGTTFWNGHRVRHAAAFQAYARAKLATLLCLPVWQRTLSEQGIQVAAVSPGYFVNTGIHREMRGIFRAVAVCVFGLGTLLRLNTPQRGARALIRMARVPATAFPDGEYWSHRSRLEPSRLARDPTLQLTAFAWSQRLCGLS